MAALHLAGSAVSGAATAQEFQIPRKVGDIIMTATNFCPAGTLPANGALLRIEQHLDLFLVFGGNAS